MENHNPTGHLITRENCILIFIDIQERLMPVIADRERVLENAIRLARFSRIISLPVVITEQEKLGTTLTELKKELVDVLPITKIHFNCFNHDIFSEQIKTSGKKTLVLTGVEAHICVAQTALSGLSGFDVHVIEDA
ncbi:MAG TPA: isochorismatase family protein, partial [Syntrophorhabdaceae bacterium]|nr:isochorismatase family protein [Syntrophorhabdaceae bacterium]